MSLDLLFYIKDLKSAATVDYMVAANFNCSLNCCGVILKCFLRIIGGEPDVTGTVEVD